MAGQNRRLRAKGPAPAVAAAGRSRASLNARLAGPRLQRVLLRLHTAAELEEFARAAFEVFNTVMPDVYVALALQIIGFEKPLIIRFSREHGGRPAWWMRFFDINPCGAYLKAHPGLKLWRPSDAFEKEEWRATDFYREFVGPMGWHYGLVLAFWEGRRLRGLASIHRSQAQGDFSAAELKGLLRLHPYLDSSIARLERLHAERNVRAAGEQLLRGLPWPTVLLDWDLKLVQCNPAARDSCALWNFGPKKARGFNSRDQFELPAMLLEKCRELKGRWNDRMLEDYKLASAAGQLVSHPERPGLRATIHLVQRSIGSISKPMFRIDFEERPGAVNETVRNLARQARLTRRERELVELLRQGTANREIASRLSLNVGTVKKELHTLYQKLRVHSRGQLMALMR